MLAKYLFPVGAVLAGYPGQPGLVAVGVAQEQDLGGRSVAFVQKFTLNGPSSVPHSWCRPSVDMCASTESRRVCLYTFF